MYDVFNGKKLFDKFVFDESFRGGVDVAADDMDGDGKADLIVGAGPGGGPHLRIYSPGQNWKEIHSFLAFDESFRGGVSEAVGRLANEKNDGAMNLIVGAGPGGGPHVRVFEIDGTNRKDVAGFYAGSKDDTGGVTVAAVSGRYVKGAFAVASAKADPDGTVRVYELGDIGVGSVGTVKLGNLGGAVRLTGGGLIYSNIPVFFGGVEGGSTARVFGVEGDDDFLTVEEYNRKFGAKAEIKTTPPDKNALAVLPIGDASITSRTLDGETVQVMAGFVPLTMIPAPERNYQTPYTILPIDPSLIADYDESPRNDPSAWFDPNKTSFRFGPFAIQFDVSKSVTHLSALDQARRLVAIAAELRNVTQYQHHHVSSYLPAATDPWDVSEVAMRQGPGIDCSDFTGFLYNYALGIHLNTAVATQGDQTTATQTFTDGTERTINIVRTTVTPGGTEEEKLARYKQLVATLQPGDLLYIDGSSPSHTGPVGAAHVIMWLGELATSPDGVPLVIDSTGPEHIDSNGIHTPSGVQMRPFEATGVNSWYFNDILSYSRVIPTTPAT